MQKIVTHDDGDRGAFLVSAIIMTTALVAISFAYFMQSRSFHDQYMRLRAEAHAKYASEYVVARYGVPTFVQRSEASLETSPEGSMIEPNYNREFIEGQHQAEDKGKRYIYSYSDLNWEPQYDVLVGKAHYFVNAVGTVGWNDSRGEHEVSHRSAVGVSFGDFSKFLYFSNRELSPENNPVRFWGPDQIYGRIHINGQAQVTPGNYPTFFGLFTQTAESVINLPEAFYPQVFQGGYQFPFPEFQWPPTDAIDQIKQAQTASHTYTDSVYLSSYDQSAPVTTNITFLDRRYRVSQYVPPHYKARYLDNITNLQERADSTFLADTLWVPLPGGALESTRSLPTAPGRQLIWVKGVARVSGRVRGQITLLSSDTMFVMDNIYTADTNVSSFGDEEEFGMVPVGSTNRIGLASEGSVFVAATPMNGAYNGGNCGFTNTSNISGGAQQNSDVVITAAIMAAHCSFGAEFWKTSVADNWVQGATSQNLQQPEECDTPLDLNQNNRWNYSMNRARTAGGPPPPFRCNTGTNDNRGKIWVCGSVVQAVRGFVRRSPIGPWGQAIIGYDDKIYRYDTNFFAAGPPVWVKARFSGGGSDLTTAMVVPDYDRWLDLREKNNLVN